VSYSLRWVDSSFKFSVVSGCSMWGTADMSVMGYIGEEEKGKEDTYLV
jgi:hypothetical protein